MFRYVFAASAAALVSTAIPVADAHAATTVLSFNGMNCVSGNVPISCSVNHDISQSYGDGAGVNVSYRAVFANGSLAANALQYRPTGTGDLSGSLISNTGPGVAGEVLFQALPGYELTLLSLDAGCRNNASGCRNLPIRVGALGGTPSLVATLANPIGGHSTLAFNLAYSSQGYVLRFGPDGFNGGLDNIAFDVHSIGGVPEASTWAMLILGFGVIGSALRAGAKRRPSLRFARA